MKAKRIDTKWAREDAKRIGMFGIFQIARAFQMPGADDGRDYSYAPEVHERYKELASEILDLLEQGAIAVSAPAAARRDAPLQAFLASVTSQRARKRFSKREGAQE